MNSFQAPWHLLQIATLVALSLAFPALAAETNLVANGTFEPSQSNSKVPEHWRTAGNQAVRQQLSVDVDSEGRPCAKLDCVAFEGDGPDFHVMLCQTGHVTVRRGQWYRLKFRAKAQGIKAGSVEVALVNTGPWENAGLAEAFPAHSQWQDFEFLFRAERDVPAAASRMQFWFKGTGTLWLSQVELTPSATGQQWFPQIATEGVKNWIPNSSFECGTANWGSYTWGLSGWAGNLYRMEGDLDPNVAWHGRHSLRIALSPETLPVFWFDYYEPIQQPVRRVLVANQGWFRVTPGEPLTLSAWLRGDAQGVGVQLAAIEAPNKPIHKLVMVGINWQRHAFTFTPTQPFLFIAVGPDLEASVREAATVWVDSVQLERGNRAHDYAPRHPVEGFLTTDTPGNLFTDVQQGAALSLHAFNDSHQERTLHGQLAVTDFYDQPFLQCSTNLLLKPHSGRAVKLNGIVRERLGYFHAQWKAGQATQALRFAVIQPVSAEISDSPFGFNHAYPWDFLLQLSRQAGIVWWRDWSAKWQTVEPERGRFDFGVADAQIRRVLKQNGEVAVLLPFPSTTWSTTARREEVEKAARDNSYLRARLPVAFAPKDLADFGRYATAVAKRYGQERPRPVLTYQVLNEPVYTDYALPRKFGYSLADYLRLLEGAHGALKAADPACRVVGGFSAGLEASLTRDFILQGGMKFVDVLDLHIYDAVRTAESYDEPFRKLAQLLQAHGGTKPIWISEWGCYADDDPPSWPQVFGDATMNRCRWPSEQAATEHIVKFASVAFAHGVRKIFFHAGTCGTINGADAGGVLFEYGGAPRKMLPGVAAFTRFVGVPEECVKTMSGSQFHACVFRSQSHVVAVAWSNGKPVKLNQRPTSVRAFDLMGNELVQSDLWLKDSPIYLKARNADEIAALFPTQRDLAEPEPN